MTNRIHHNANTISHLSQEAPLPFKKYTKKRSWVWDWFEQDPDNKYRAVCLYCHSEIFRLDGDRGSPKKLITHVNSKHGINKENYNSSRHADLRLEKLKMYVDLLGPLVTNRDDAISLGIMNSGIQNTSSVTSSFISFPEHNVQQSPPPAQQQANNNPYNPLNGSIGVIIGETRPQLPMVTRQNPTPPPVAEQNVKEDSNVALNQIDPSLAQHTPHRSGKQEEIDRYNDLIINHNRQVEEYNKATIIKANGGSPSYQKPLNPLIDSTTDIDTNDDDNEIQKALKRFIAENSPCFNNLNFIESPSFRKFMKVVRENPGQSI